MQKLNDNHHLQKRYLYAGIENKLEKIGYFPVELICTFDISLFPFDAQKCKMRMKVESSGRLPPLIQIKLDPKSCKKRSSTSGEFAQK